MEPCELTGKKEENSKNQEPISLGRIASHVLRVNEVGDHKEQ
jgi:hypothetical protein